MLPFWFSLSRPSSLLRPALVGLSDAIHDEPELCFEEVRAAQRVGDMLSDAGFTTAAPPAGRRVLMRRPPPGTRPSQAGHRQAG